MSSNNDNNNQSIDNKHFVIRAKTILKDMGVEASTSQIYELFSKLNGEKNWNVAKSKNLNFLEKLQSYFEPQPSNTNEDKYSSASFDEWLKKNKNLLEMAYYEECLKKGDFKDIFCYGISHEKENFNRVNPFEKPGALYVGTMGSGKSVAMKFTVLTHMLSNSENSVYILYDQYKDMGDYKEMFNLSSHVIKVISDGNKIISLIDNLFLELKARKEAFEKVKAVNIHDYESKKNNSNVSKLSRIILVAEEFHGLMSNPSLNYQYHYNIEDTPAWKFRLLMRVGRSYGIFMLGATSSFTSDDFLIDLKPAISVQMAFRCSSPKSISSMNLPEAVDIKIPGRCLTVGDKGYSQFLMFDDKATKELIKKYLKNRTSGFAVISFDDLKKLLE